MMPFSAEVIVESPAPAPSGGAERGQLAVCTRALSDDDTRNQRCGVYVFARRDVGALKVIHARILLSSTFTKWTTGEN